MHKRTGRSPRRVKFNLDTYQALLRHDLEPLLRGMSWDQAIRRVEACSLQGLHPETAFAARQILASVQKNKDAPGSSPSQRKTAAIEKFLAMEAHCEKFAFQKGPIGSMVNGILSEAQLFIQDTLGGLSAEAMSAMYEGCEFGPGMTYGSVDRSSASLAYKVGGRQTITRAAVPYWADACLEFPGYQRIHQAGVDIVRGNRVTTVPKTADIDRTIAIEPSLNVFLQKGVDRYMRQRLARKGVDLTDQSVGHPRAAEGSVGGQWATIDLSSASDTVSTALVKNLLPADWFILLDDLRSREYTLDKGKRWSVYHKFSSMGNAFTFPLETLIFKSLCVGVARTLGERDQSVVYGDDIVVPANHFAILVETLQAAGFIPNVAKSFGFGPFRETCGQDFLLGVDIRPIYLASNPRNEVEVYNLHNRLLNNRQGVSFDETLRYLFSLVPKPMYQPRDLSPGERWWVWEPYKAMVFDRGFMVPPHYVTRYRSHHPNFQHESWRVRQWTRRLRPLRGNWEDCFLLLSLVSGSHKPVDQGSTYYSTRLVTYTRWPSGGKWPSYTEDPT